MINLLFKVSLVVSYRCTPPPSLLLSATPHHSPSSSCPQPFGDTKYSFTFRSRGHSRASRERGQRVPPPHRQVRNLTCNSDQLAYSCFHVKRKVCGRGGVRAWVRRVRGQMSFHFVRSAWCSFWILLHWFFRGLLYILVHWSIFWIHG